MAANDSEWDYFRVNIVENIKLPPTENGRPETTGKLNAYGVKTKNLERHLLISFQTTTVSSVLLVTLMQLDRRHKLFTLQ